MTTQNRPKCPPCYRDCRQGRRCTAEPAPAVEPDDEFGGELSRIVEKVQVGCAITFALCVLGAVVVLLLRGCSA